MDALSTDDDPLPGTIATARAALAMAVHKANLTGDPLGPALDAVSLSLAAQLALHQASTGHLRDVSGRLDLQVSRSLAHADSELAAKQAAIVARLAPQLASAADQCVRARLWTIKLRTLAMAAGGAVILAVGALAGGYGMGYASGQAAGLITSGTIAASAGRDGPAAATTWAQLIGDNDVRAAMADCAKTLARQDGRRACSLPVWLDPPPAPAPAPTPAADKP